VFRGRYSRNPIALNASVESISRTTFSTIRV
jgi:hypothetical protein